MNVSIVIPAHNAEATIAETLQSVLGQTCQTWEAIVIDDGSTDATAAIAAGFEARDSRFRVVRQPPAGASAARNAGIRLARFDWLLFLDSDDWILPRHLERLTALLESDPELDAAHCGYARVAPTGDAFGETFGPPSADLFSAFARLPAFVIHACIVRRSIIMAVGGFDPNFHACQDWDLWQRVARTGARFGAVREVLAHYRVRRNSISSDGTRMLRAGLRVIENGHSPDARVPSVHPAHVNGLPHDELRSQQFYLLCWCAGLVIGEGRATGPLLDLVEGIRPPPLEPGHVADQLFGAVPVSRVQPPADWPEFWPSVSAELVKFLAVIEERSATPDLAQRVLRILEWKALEEWGGGRPVAMGLTLGVRIEVSEPICDIAAPEPVERLHAWIELEGERLGVLGLPICSGAVSKYVLTDAIAAQFAWPILGRFFERTLYQTLSTGCDADRTWVHRGELPLAELRPDDAVPSWRQAHDSIGWTVFLQEIWGRPDWPISWFYDPSVQVDEGGELSIAGPWFACEVSRELANLHVSHPELNVLVTVGGVGVGTVVIRPTNAKVRAQELRAAITSALAFELCRAAVREGVVGRQLNGSGCLRSRLRLAGSAAVEQPAAPVFEVAQDVLPAPGFSDAIRRGLAPFKSGLLIGQPTGARIGTSSSRRALIPVAAAAECVEAFKAAGHPVAAVPRFGISPKCLVHAPDLIAEAPRMHSTDRPRPLPPRTPSVSVYDRHFFERVFAEEDPWKYTSSYEQMKYEQTLGLLPGIQFGTALELGCAEGHFTAKLAPRVRNLIAADISQTALDRAAQRCAHLKNIRFERLDLARDSLPSDLDLIVCSEVLYFLSSIQELKKIARKFAGSLRRGGYLLMAHTNLVADEPDQTGFNWNFPFGAKGIGEIFAGTRPLRMVRELRTPLYRIQLLRREPWTFLPGFRKRRTIVELAEHAPRRPGSSSQILWGGGKPAEPQKVLQTDRLPILLYHRILPDGLHESDQYRITPKAFEEQLRYLREAGYYSVPLDNWLESMGARRPLPGRAVLITFDDGDRSFLDHARPLLEKHGFSAALFVVSDEVGGLNRWDRGTEAEVPLLGWPEIRLLKEEGIAIGSHAATHRPLTGLSIDEVVREAARSKAKLEHELGGSIRAFAYPYGDVDPVVQHLVGASGYTCGFTCKAQLSEFHNHPLGLPRILVRRTDTLQDFVAKLAW